MINSFALGGKQSPFEILTLENIIIKFYNLQCKYLERRLYYIRPILAIVLYRSWGTRNRSYVGKPGIKVRHLRSKRYNSFTQVITEHVPTLYSITDK